MLLRLVNAVDVFPLLFVETAVNILLKDLEVA